MAEEEVKELLPEITPAQRLDLNARSDIFNAIVTNFPCSVGKEASKNERDANLMTESTLTYGEVDFMSLGETFYNIKNRYGGIPPGPFYDLGSGTGKGNIAAAVLHPFEESVGIEILKSLYDISVNIHEEYQRIMPSKVQEYPDLFSSEVPVKFIFDDIFSHDWSNAGIVFCNSTCFSREMMDRISEMPVKEGTIAITLTKNFNSAKWEVLESARKNMSWGDATVFISRRRADKAQEETETS